MFDRDMSHRVRAIVVLVCMACAVPPVNAAGKLAFAAGEQGAYTFDTGLLRGTLCAGGKSSGLTSVVHIPTGTRLEKGSGIFGYYRLLATNHRYGRMGWDLPGTSRLLVDGAVEITLPVAEDRPFELVAVYRWASPGALDLETIVKPSADLSNFEVFLASYFSESLPSPYVCAQSGSGQSGREGFLLAERSYGDWLMFPRDKGLLPMIGDGRWTKEPYPVTWTVMPRLQIPLAFRRGGDSAPVAVLMAPRQDCCAVSTPYEGESHYSLYLSLFGRDIGAGKAATARARFVVTTPGSERQILKLYENYIRQLAASEKPASVSP